MKQETINKKCIAEILNILKKYSRNPEQTRYIFKKVRENGGYQVQKVRKKLPEFLNDAEIRHVIDTAHKEKNTLVSTLMLTGIYTGLRISELRNLKIQDIDFNNYQLRVINGKGSKDREVVLPQEVTRVLIPYLNGRKKGFVFCKKDETPYTIRALQVMIKRVFDRLGLNKTLSAHSLRHTYATLLLRRGVSLERIQLLMGHSSRITTEVYTHLELAPIKEEVLRILN